MSQFTIGNGDTDEYSTFTWEVWSPQGKKIKALFDIMVGKGSRNWSLTRKIWFVHNSVAEPFIQGITMLFQVDPEFKYWTLKDNRVKLEDFNDFFENQGHSLVGTAPKTKEVLQAEFLALAEEANISFKLENHNIQDLNFMKKLYRQAALALHPDRNNGDGTKMAELNIIWAELQTKF